MRQWKNVVSYIYNYSIDQISKIKHLKSFYWKGLKLHTYSLSPWGKKSIIAISNLIWAHSFDEKGDKQMPIHTMLH